MWQEIKETIGAIVSFFAVMTVIWIAATWTFQIGTISWLKFGLELGFVVVVLMFCTPAYFVTVPFFEKLYKTLRSRIRR